MVGDRYSDLVINEVITYIHEHIYDPLPLSRLSSYAGYSPYHFTRIFKEKIGLSPLYYVSSLKLEKAKDLLLHTNFSVRDIGMEIGQQSLGTFTTRFTKRIGVTPSKFRNSALEAGEHFDKLRTINHWSLPLLKTNQDLIVKGTVSAEVPFQGIILIGLFPKPIPEGLPLYGTLLSSLGDFCFTDVKPGIYYMMATSVSWEMKAKDFLLPYTTLRAKLKEPIIVKPYSTVPHQHVILRKPRLDDPPILVSLPLLMNRFFNRVVKK
ncbi:helix-turn-helix transcriptional regulator [Pueribacillus theae]|uniref:helix-turn-helix transcriptional regulator n=1 Tax=Pueribacillus theae TaxID=2171751 RepID=UPI00197E678F|nr:AraC family transcriptional regulator [Pueribacillus theae]